MLHLPPPASVEEVGAGVSCWSGFSRPRLCLGSEHRSLVLVGPQSVAAGSVPGDTWQTSPVSIAENGLVFFFRNPAIKKLAGKKECNNVGPVHQDAAAPVQGEASSNPLAEVMGLGVREGRPTPNLQMAADCQAT